MAKDKQPESTGDPRDEIASTPAQGDFPEVMTVKQAAEYLQVNEQVLYRYVREGKVPVAKLGTTIRFKRSVIDLWLARESWESIGVSLSATGKPRQRPQPSRPVMPMELD